MAIGVATGVMSCVMSIISIDLIHKKETYAARSVNNIKKTHTSTVHSTFQLSTYCHLFPLTFHFLKFRCSDFYVPRRPRGAVWPGPRLPWEGPAAGRGLGGRRRGAAAAGLGSAAGGCADAGATDPMVATTVESGLKYLS